MTSLLNRLEYKHKEEGETDSLSDEQEHAVTATSADLTTDLYTHLLDYDLPGPERRRVEWLISEALADAYDKSGVDFGEQDFRQMLPHALGRTLVQLLAPIADSPHACAEIEFTRYVLDALYVRLGA